MMNLSTRSPSQLSSQDMDTAWIDIDDDVPPALLKYRNCAPWQLEPLKNNIKLFYNPHTLERKPAKSDDPSTTAFWGLAKARMHKLLDRSFGVQPVGGMGILLGVDQGDGTSIGGIDLDTCIRDDVLAPWAIEIIGSLGSYVEISPSGGGAHVLFRYKTGELDALKAAAGGKSVLWRGAGANGSRHSPGIELYFSSRFFAVSGNRVGNCRNLDIISIDTVKRLSGIAAKLPRSAGKTSSGKTSSGKKAGGVPDRSAMATSLLVGLLRANANLTFDEGMAALAGAGEPLVVEWYEEQAGPAGDRQLQRHWDFAVKSAAELRERDAARKTFSEDVLALEFVARYCDQLRYCHTTGAWFVWTGKAWRKDETQQVYTLARRYRSRPWTWGGRIPSYSPPTSRSRSSRPSTWQATMCGTATSCRMKTTI